MVWPSGSARATVSEARMPPAPGMFSTTTCCPRPSLILGARVRVVMSAMPPGPNGRTIRTGLLGYPWAATRPGNSMHAKSHFFISSPPSRVHPAGVALEYFLLVRRPEGLRSLDVALRIVVIMPGFRVDAAHRADHFGSEQDVFHGNDLEQQVDPGLVVHARV